MGQLLDMIKFTVKLFFIRNDSKCTTDLDRLFHEMFHRLPEAWEEDPVKVSDGRKQTIKFNLYA